jgi:hypothetical protein
MERDHFTRRCGGQASSVSFAFVSCKLGNYWYQRLSTRSTRNIIPRPKKRTRTLLDLIRNRISSKGRVQFEEYGRDVFQSTKTTMNDSTPVTFSHSGPVKTTPSCCPGPVRHTLLLCNHEMGRAKERCCHCHFGGGSLPFVSSPVFAACRVARHTQCRLNKWT